MVKKIRLNPLASIEKWGKEFRSSGNSCRTKIGNRVIKIIKKYGYEYTLIESNNVDPETLESANFMNNNGFALRSCKKI